MEVATGDGLDGQFDGRECVEFGESLGTSDLAVNRYRLAPGEGFPSGLHAHFDQEEVFVVLSGEAVFEMYLPSGDTPESAKTVGREVTVSAGEVVRFAPGDFQTGRNPASADGDLLALAVGAPKDSGDVRIPVTCLDCGDGFLALGTGGDELTFDCPACGESFTPAPCPDCGEHALSMHLDDDGRPVSSCDGCDSEYAEPPVAD